jgi:hypothetical protein
MLHLAVVAVLALRVTVMQPVDQHGPISAVGVHLMTDEAGAVLGILAKRNNQLPLVLPRLPHPTTHKTRGGDPGRRRETS